MEGTKIEDGKIVMQNCSAGDGQFDRRRESIRACCPKLPVYAARNCMPPGLRWTYEGERGGEKFEARERNANIYKTIISESDREDVK